MEMKKQVLSFTEFINEAYSSLNKIAEGNSEGASDLITAISKLKDSGLSAEAKDKLELLSGIAKSVESKTNPDAEKELGESLLNFINNVSTNDIKISSIKSQTNIIKYPYLVNGKVIVDNDAINLLDFVHSLNLENCNSKSTVGASDGVNWNKLKTSKRFTSSVSGRYAGKLGNFIASFFVRDPKTEDKDKDTKYLASSGLLNQSVITGIESNNITVAICEPVLKDMALGGSDKEGKDRKGLSNIGGIKQVVTGAKIYDPLGSELEDYQKNPTKGKSKVSKNPKAYFSLVLYSIGNSTKNSEGIKYTDMKLTQKMVPTGVTKTYTETIFNNTDEGKGNDYVLFDKGESKLKPAGKNNIKSLIESFYSIKSIEIQGSASDEGDQKFNEDLCIARANSVRDEIIKVKEFKISPDLVTVSKTAKIQPPVDQKLTPEKKEELRKPHRKVTFIIEGIKSNETPNMVLKNEYSPTLDVFYAETVEIYQTVLTLEVSQKKTYKVVK